jgi:DNA modification methylase
VEIQLRAFKGAGVNLDNMGFDADALDDLFAGNRGDAWETTEDDVPDAPEKATTQPGDLWELGDRLLYCGDSRQAGELQAVMGRARANAVVTDPPYGVSYVGRTADALTIKNDGSEGLRQLLQDALTAAKGVCREGAAWYVAAPAGPQFLEFAQVLSDLEMWRQTIVWVKDVLVMGHSDYHYRHEVLFYGWVLGAAHMPPADRKQDTAWEIARPKRSEEHPTHLPLRGTISPSTKIDRSSSQPLPPDGNRLLDLVDV